MQTRNRYRNRAVDMCIYQAPANVTVVWTYRGTFFTKHITIYRCNTEGNTFLFQAYSSNTILFQYNKYGRAWYQVLE